MVGVRFAIGSGLVVGLIVGLVGVSGCAWPCAEGALRVPGQGCVADDDGDGLRAPQDLCPQAAEDPDTFEDSDGCPEADNDQDAVCDEGLSSPECQGADLCPMDPEDRDGFEDEDGCPDPDNDQDGILDIVDACPFEPEDKDNFGDEEGCPDPDNDQDGILDAGDMCPNEPEIFNAFEDEDGCPDRGTTLTMGDNIQVLERISFDTGRHQVKKRFVMVIKSVADTMINNPELVLMEVVGHCDDQEGSADLSQRRAQGVMELLVESGVDAARLKAVSKGAEQPLMSVMDFDGSALSLELQRKARAQNRRVEFNIVEVDRSKQGVEPSSKP